MIDLRATSCWVGAQQHISWPVPWLLRYTCASGRNNTASLGIYILDSGDQFDQSKYLIKCRDQLPHINPTRPESRIKHRISFIFTFFYMENSESTQQLYKQKEKHKFSRVQFYFKCHMLSLRNLGRQNLNNHKLRGISKRNKLLKLSQQI